MDEWKFELLPTIDHHKQLILIQLTDMLYNTSGRGVKTAPIERGPQEKNLRSFFVISGKNFNPYPSILPSYLKSFGRLSSLNLNIHPPFCHTQRHDKSDNNTYRLSESQLFDQIEKKAVSQQCLGTSSKQTHLRVAFFRAMNLIHSP